ncbi:MAG: ADOP family duplicated permease [Longimicrobiales bacterium]
MRRIGGLRRFFCLPTSERTVGREIDDEVAFHVESRTEELMRAGQALAAARAQALREFGDVSGAREELHVIDRARLRQARRTDVADAFRLDVRNTGRGLMRAPGFTVGVVLTLGLGLGLNAAMFGITDRLLFRPPGHITAPEQVKRVYFTFTTPGGSPVSERAAAYVEYEAMRALKAFQDVGAYFNVDASMGRGQGAQKVRAMLATASLFATLGVKPRLGRFFGAEEDAPGKAAAVVVLSYPFWQRQFGGETSALGRTVDVGKQTYTVIGVAPKGFTGAELEPVDLLVPVSAGAPELFGDGWNRGRNWSWLRIIARLRPGVTVAAADAEATSAFRAVAGSRQTDPAVRVHGESLILGRAPADWSNTLPDTARIALWLSGVSLIVLLIACANVINLMLARLARRRREVGIRLALGIAHARLVGQCFIETSLLTLGGAGVGLALATWGGALMRRQLLPGLDWSGGVVDQRALIYMAVLVLTCVSMSVIPSAIQSLRTDLITVLKSGWRGQVGSRTRNVLVVVQAALSVILLIGAGMFVRSMLNLRNLNKGYDAERVIALYWDNSVLGLRGPEHHRLYLDAAERVRQLRVVETAAVSVTVPFWSSISTDLRVQGWDSLPRVPDGGPFYNGVTPEYFRTLGTRIVRGRAFTATEGRPGQTASIVSATMARMLWPGQNPLGKCLYVGDAANKPPCSPVVGVAEDALRQSLEGGVMQYYLPIDQVTPSLRALFIRTRGDPHEAVMQIRDAVQSLRPDLPFADMRALQELMEPYTRPWRLGAALFSAFGLLALLLAAIGLYSVIAYNVTLRAQEMGVRLALGARSAQLLGLVLREAGLLVGVGFVLGALGALAVGARVREMLFQVSPRDPTVFAGVAGVVVMVGLVATLWPARRALRTDPLVALKAD